MPCKERVRTRRDRCSLYRPCTASFDRNFESWADLISSLGSHAALRDLVAGFRAARDLFGRVAAVDFFRTVAARSFLRGAAAVFLALAWAATGAGNSSVGCFAVRWWPCCSGWMRAASAAIRSSASSRCRRSSSRYSGIVLVVMASVWQNYPRPSCLILVTP